MLRKYLVVQLGQVVPLRRLPSPFLPRRGHRQVPGDQAVPPLRPWPARSSGRPPHRVMALAALWRLPQRCRGLRASHPAICN